MSEVISLKNDQPGPAAFALNSYQVENVAEGLEIPTQAASKWLAQELIRVQKQLANCVTDRENRLLQLAKYDTPDGADARKVLGEANDPAGAA